MLIHPRKPAAYRTYAAIETREHLFRRQTMNVASVYNNSQTITVRNWTCGIEQTEHLSRAAAIQREASGSMRARIER